VDVSCSESDELIYTWSLYTCSVCRRSLEVCTTFKDIFPGLSGTLSCNFQYFPTPKYVPGVSRSWNFQEQDRRRRNRGTQTWRGRWRLTAPPVVGEPVDRHPEGSCYVKRVAHLCHVCLLYCKSYRQWKVPKIDQYISQSYDENSVVYFLSHNVHKTAGYFEQIRPTGAAEKVHNSSYIHNSFYRRCHGLLSNNKIIVWYDIRLLKPLSECTAYTVKLQLKITKILKCLYTEL